MSAEDRERERLRRLRERQIAARDPGDRGKVKWKGEAAKKPQGSLWQEIFGVLPGRVKGGLVGGAIGLVLYFVTSFVIRNLLALPEEWTLCAVAILLVCTLLGLVVGKSMDFD